jgi:hypothetical protein
VSNGAKLSLLIHADFGGDSYPTAHITFHPLGGTLITSLAFVDLQEDGKPRMSIPGALGKAWSGCGPLSCSAGQINGGS